jgi:NodT family efflux transporter outer membrane factor (OMF) lipoprotein
MRYKTSFAVVSVMLLAGCTSLGRTSYVTPPVPMPVQFEHAGTADMGPVRQDRWWTEFNDPALDTLIETAIARNPDLAVAAIRVRRATLQARLAGNALLPIPSGSVSTGVSRALDKGKPATEAASGSVGLSWEVDLFGKIAAQRDAATFEARATAEDRDAAALALVGTTATLYWQIAFANERIALAEQSLAYSRQTQALVETQYRAGAVSRLERNEVVQSVATQEAALQQLIQIRTEARESIGVLLDGAQMPVTEPQLLNAVPLPPVAAGIPAELLGRRPDLRAAELRLRRTLANGDATRLSYYPALTLTGSLGGSSASLLHVLANPIATLGAGLALPFLNWEAMRFDSAIARTQTEEAVVLFRKSLYTALSEVENALSARLTLAAQSESLRRSRDAAMEVERIYEIRYRAGAVPLRAWLDAQERRRSADVALSANQLERLQNQVTLHQAVGGSFETQ